MNTKIKFESEKCACCNQSVNYLVPIDYGTIRIVKQIAKFIGKKGINAVHPRKEMEWSMLSSNEVGNLSRPRIHGLIAKIKDKPGNYCLTSKGSKFLHGESIPKFAIRSKTDHCTVGYYLPETFSVIVHDMQGDGDYWDGINFSIEEGHIIHDL